MLPVGLQQQSKPKGRSYVQHKDDAYAFIFSQQGLMAGVSIEGTKISRIKR
jgi:lipid-binding SYLF domain-containing protein